MCKNNPVIRFKEIFTYVQEHNLNRLCEILFAETKKVLLDTVLMRKNLIRIYFQHTFTYPTTILVSSVDLSR